MANYTPNLNLEKPLQSEDYDVDVFNRNSDKIDNFAGTIPARALTSDKLTTGAKINGVNFKGDTDITLPVATTSVAGTVKPDDDTIKIDNNGVINVNENKFDGAWQNATSENISLTSVTAIGSYNVDLSIILPNDANSYECVLRYFIVRRDNNSDDSSYKITSSGGKVWIWEHVEGDAQLATNYRRKTGQFSAIVGSERKLVVAISEKALYSSSLELIMYRKCVV